MRLISSRQRRRRFRTRVFDVEFIVTNSVFMAITKVPYGPRETAITRDWWLVVVTIVIWCPLWILDVLRRAWNRRFSFRLDRWDADTQQASPMLSYSNKLCLVPVTKVPCGPRETVISRDQWLVVVTVVVWCPLRVISNRHLPVTFLDSFVILAVTFLDSFVTHDR
jgi:hypothetical protein